MGSVDRGVSAASETRLPQRLLDHHRELRHENQLDFTFITSKEEAENTLRTAREFVTRTRFLLEKQD